MSIYYIRKHDYVAHSSGPWKNHKYIKKVGNDYIYSEEDQKHLDQKADEVIKGKYKNGEERRKALEKEGESYEAIQNTVNKKLGNNYRYEIKQDGEGSSDDKKSDEKKKEKEIMTSNPSLVGSKGAKKEGSSSKGGSGKSSGGKGSSGSGKSSGGSSSKSSGSSGSSSKSSNGSKNGKSSSSSSSKHKKKGSGKSSKSSGSSRQGIMAWLAQFFGV